MSDPSLEVQRAIVASLKAAGIKLLDPVPAGTALPYVSLGAFQVLPDKADCIDGAELSIQIDAWSGKRDGQEAKELAKAIVEKLDDQPLVVAGQDCIVFEHESTQFLPEPDGVTKHAAITFRALVYPT